MSVTLAELRASWHDRVVPAIAEREPERGKPVARLVGEAFPDLVEGALVVVFPARSEFHARLVEAPWNVALVQEAVYGVTGVRLPVEVAVA